MRNHPVLRCTAFLALASLVLSVLSGCTFSLSNLPVLIPPTATASYPIPPTAAPLPLAGVTFTVTLPAPLANGESLYLSVVDEVTGLGLNPADYTMQGVDTLHYSVSIPFALNSVVKYRYYKQGTLPISEVGSANQAVRYRLYSVTGPGSVADVVAAWAGTPFAGAVGRVAGQVVDAASGAPLADILVDAGGEQALTDLNGAFALEGLPAGTHNLVAYALDGTYQTYQQGARVEVNKRTPVRIALTAAPLVNVVFTLIVPTGSIPSTAVPVRMAGNLLQLGNTFGDLDAGINTVATRMPVLTPMQDGRYTLSLNLPAGADVRYKYTLGDGFWNAEHAADGSFVVRQLVVPNSQTPVQVQDVVSSWQAGSSAPIVFEASVPADTPASDIVSIQFNPYGWTEPIPMWPRGNNQWVYELYGPLNMLGEFSYRYCRNDQCGVADDVATSAGHGGRPISSSLVSQDLQDTVTAWTWLQDVQPAPLVGLTVNPRASGFLAGVEFTPAYDPTWQAWQPPAIQNVKALGANLLVLTPTWTVSQTNPFVFSPVPGKDALWADTADTIGRARASGLSVALFPQPNLPADAVSWWAAAPRNPDWWNAWFSAYQAFADYHADLATRAGAQMLILGGGWVTPALPNGILGDRSSSGVPSDAEARWSSILADVRGRFKGSIYWAQPSDNLQSAASIIKNLDGVYLLWNPPPLDSASTLSLDNLHSAAGSRLDAEVQPFQASLQKPVILAVACPSASGAASLSLPEGTLFQPGGAAGAVDLQAQADLYQALMQAVNERSWLGGIVSRGYYPPVGLQDASASVHGKPAANVLWYWYPRFLGVVH